VTIENSREIAKGNVLRRPAATSATLAGSSNGAGPARRTLALTASFPDPGALDRSLRLVPQRILRPIRISGLAVFIRRISILPCVFSSPFILILL